MTTTIDRQLFGKADVILEESLNHRLKRQNVIAGNVANSETPGFRALEYNFENQLQAAIGRGDELPMKATDARHIVSPGLDLDGKIRPDLHVRPTESIGNDGNSVDVDAEMANMAENQIVYRSTIETLNRRLALLRYGINGGGH